MFSTMPFLSSVWNVKATSAGILARKLVSGLPSGSRRLACLRLALNFRTGISPRMRSRSLAWLRKVRPRVRPAMAVGGRLHRQDADGVDVVVRVAAGVGALVEPVERRAVDGRVERVEVLVSRCGSVPPANVAVTLPGCTTPLG